MGLIQLLNESNNRVDNIIDYIQSTLSLDITEDEDYEFLDQGQYAKVYSIKSAPDKVLRIEDDVYESFFERIEELDLKNVVYVYYSHIFETDKFREVEVTLMEKLNPVPEFEKEELIHVGEYYNLYEVLDMDWRNKYEFENIVHILEDIENGIKELEENDIYLNDLHFGNIMYDSKYKSYKIIDLSNV